MKKLRKASNEVIFGILHEYEEIDKAQRTARRRFREAAKYIPDDFKVSAEIGMMASGIALVIGIINIIQFYFGGAL